MARWIAGLDGCRGAWAGALLDLDDPGRHRGGPVPDVAASSTGRRRRSRRDRRADRPARPGRRRRTRAPTGPRAPISAPAGRASSRCRRGRRSTPTTTTRPRPCRGPTASRPSRPRSSAATSSATSARWTTCCGRGRTLATRLHEVHPEVAFRRLNGDRPLGCRQEGAAAPGQGLDAAPGAPGRRRSAGDAGRGAAAAGRRRPTTISTPWPPSSSPATSSSDRAEPLPDPPERDALRPAGGDLGAGAPCERRFRAATVIMPVHRGPSPARPISADTPRDPPRRPRAGLRSRGPASADRLRVGPRRSSRTASRCASGSCPAAGWSPARTTSRPAGANCRRRSARDDAEIGPQVAACDGPFHLFRQSRDARERYFLVRLPDDRVDTSRLAETEDNPVLGTRWWTLAELHGERRARRAGGPGRSRSAIVAGTFRPGRVVLTWHDT